MGAEELGFAAVAAPALSAAGGLGAAWFLLKFRLILEPFWLLI